MRNFLATRTPMGPVIELAKNTESLVIEDCAQAFTAIRSTPGIRRRMWQCSASVALRADITGRGSDASKGCGA